MVQITETVTLVAVTCYACGTTFSMTDSLYRNCQDNGKTFYCPNGHGQVFTKTTEQLLQEAKKKLSQKEFELIAERNLHLATQRKMKRLEKRISKGVCPCCHRQFVNMTKHMETKHPDFAKE